MVNYIKTRAGELQDFNSAMTESIKKIVDGVDKLTYEAINEGFKYIISRRGFDLNPESGITKGTVTYYKTNKLPLPGNWDIVDLIYARKKCEKLGIDCTLPYEDIKEQLRGTNNDRCSI